MEHEEDARFDLEAPSYNEDIALAGLWVLADKMAIPALQNFVVSKIGEIRKASNNGVATSTLPYIYSKTAVDSPLRHLMVSEVGWEG